MRPCPNTTSALAALHAPAASLRPSHPLMPLSDTRPVSALVTQDEVERIGLGTYQPTVMVNPAQG